MKSSHPDQVQNKKDRFPHPQGEPIFCFWVVGGDWNRIEVHKIAGSDFARTSEASAPAGWRAGCPP